MDYNEFSKLVMSRQACRNFIDKEIEQEKLHKICSLARFAPSACNSQPWKMYCVADKTLKAEVNKAIQTETKNLFTSNAGALIAVSEKPAILFPEAQKIFGANHFVKYDIGELVAYITLTAKSLGIDSCVIGWVDNEKISKTLGFEENEECRLVIALGYSEAPLRSKIRKEESEIIKMI